MRSARGILVGIGLCVLWTAPVVRADGWVGALSELRVAPAGVNDSALPLSARIAAARALGAFGPAREATPVLLRALDARPAPALRDEILLALARRAPAAAEPRLRALLARDGPILPAVAAALGAIGSASALRALVAALGREQPASIERALVDAGSAATAPLIEALSGPLAVRSAGVLGQLGPGVADAAEPALLRALSARAPELRTAAAVALGQLGHTGSAPALLARARDADPNTAQAALAALERVASPVQAVPLVGLLLRVPSAQRPLVLRALAHADAARASAVLATAVAGDDAALRAAARELIESAPEPDPSWVPSLASVLSAELGEAAASALARVPDGRGLPALIAVAERMPDAAQRCARALALGLRRFAEQLDDAALQRAHAVLHSLPPGERRLLLCALARDRAALRFAITGLDASDPSRRAASARALSLLGDVRANHALAAALARERDAEALRRMAEAAFELDVEMPAASAWRALRDAETAPEVMQLMARRWRTAPPRAFRVFLRRALSSSPAARVRAAAALALARLGDARAVAPLQAALADASPHVRLAAVRALAALGGAATARELRVHARFERDVLVGAVARAQAARAGRPAPLTPCGAHTLELRLRARGTAEPRPLVDVLLRDGRWLRMRAQAGSELIVTDLQDGLADVRALD